MARAKFRLVCEIRFQKIGNGSSYLKKLEYKLSCIWQWLIKV